MPSTSEGPPAPRSGRTTVPWQVLAILAVAVTVVVAMAGLCYWLSTTVSSHPPDRPVVTFYAAELDGGNATVVIAADSRPLTPSHFLVNLVVVHQGYARIGIATAMPTVNGSAVFVPVYAVESYRVVWIDPGGTGLVATGSVFRVTGYNALLPAASEYAFFLLWSDDSQTASVTFATP